MAEMIIPQKKGRRKIHSLRVDLTPMVDLGFLLITFFMLSTTLEQLKVMNINMPDNEPTLTHTVFEEEATITLIPSRAHTVYYYDGILKDPTQLKHTEISKARTVLLSKQTAVIALPASLSADAHKQHVLIKPTNDCSYADLVSILDEMNILSIPYYAIVDLTKEEEEMIQAH